MKTDIQITTVEEFHKLIRKHWNAHYIYRGENSDSYELKPKYGRTEMIGKRDRYYMEQLYFNEFKRTSIPFLETKLEND